MPTLIERSNDNVFMIVMLVSLSIMVSLCLTCSICVCCTQRPVYPDRLRIAAAVPPKPLPPVIIVVESPGESPESQFYAIGSAPPRMR